jgi:serine/threonine protein phosphatase 1
LLRSSLPPSTPIGAEGASTDSRLIYAIGDIHGRIDLLDRLLDQIRQDARGGRRPTKPVLIFMGDYVDRGPASRAVIARLIELTHEADFEVRALKGNHEQTLLAFLDDAEVGPTWRQHGGGQTLVSYGVIPPLANGDAEGWAKAREAFVQALPTEHRAFLTSLALMVVYGDYVFVHAGLRPGVTLEDQVEADLLWIRQAFLGADGPFGKIVVHGHTPVEQAGADDYRISIDTGAYATGILTAVRLEGATRRFLQSGRAPEVAEPADTPETPASRPKGGVLALASLIFGAVIVGVAVMLANGVVPFRSARPVATTARAPTSVSVAEAPMFMTVGPAVNLRPEVGPETPALATEPKAPPAAPAVSGPSVQIGAYASQALADRGWRDLGSAEPAMLKGKSKAVQTATVGGKVFYRALVVGFETRADAASFCAALKEAGRACFQR